ncbi:phosphotransferase enzyme family protein [Hymenobacter sp. CRA2]|uniref:phosphotransferase enzyme family protein n=1 Tax=Hymenobacter sp. CRA2 TaxID=1955620 RepID=UPI00098FC100|nr:phosphotransferase [Hymenobacter sp. CRA2]OON70177.1 hypothetical protein B0919_05435 [Hymenobacter sp. CRA2]
MSVFPTQYSTLSARALQDYVAARYALPLHGSRLLLRGVSDTYQLESATAKYIFKVYRAAHRSRAEIEGEVELLTRLHAQGASVAPPLPDQHGALLQTFAAAEGPRHGVLFAYAPGKSHFDLSEAQLRTVGTEMARLHQLTAGLQLSQPRRGYDLRTTLAEPLARLASAFTEYEYPEGLAYLQIAAEQARAQLADLGPEAFSYGYCHYDLLPKNFHFASEDQLTFFDFDFAGPGWLVNDVMTFKVHYFLHVFTRRLSPAEAEQAWQLFLSSYRAVRPLSEPELAAIPALGVGFWVFYLAFAYEHFDDWSNTFFGPRYLRERVGLIRQWVEWQGGFGSAARP